jgi:hypothetical protein
VLSAGGGRCQCSDPGARGLRATIRQPSTTRLLPWADTQCLRQRRDDTVPGNLQGRQQLGTTRPHRSRMALAQVPTRQPPVPLVCPEDRRSIAADPAHHADCLGSKAGDLTLALCRNRLGTRRGRHGKDPATYGRRNVIPRRLFRASGPAGSGSGATGSSRIRLASLAPAKSVTPSPRSSALCMQDCGKPSWSCRI